MRKKWGMILGLTGMMLLGAQSIYAAEAADGTARQQMRQTKKKQQTQMILRLKKIKKGGFTADFRA